MLLAEIPLRVTTIDHAILPFASSVGNAVTFSDLNATPAAASASNLYYCSITAADRILTE
jgi:hypothetical protein